MSGNPFFRPAPVVEPPPEPVERDPLLGDRVRLSGPKVPIETIAPPPDPVLDRVPVGDLQPTVWVVGAHGGAGATSIAHAIPGAKECVRAWPVAGTAASNPLVLLVARTHRSGLDALGNAVQEWASGDVPWLQLLGTLIIDDAPKVPAEVRPQITRLLRATPSGWHLGWQPAWRHLPLTDRPLSRGGRRTLSSIAAEAAKARS